MQNDDLELINSQTILRCIEHDLDKPTRALIAKYTGLSRNATSVITQKLIKIGLIKELETTRTGRGRPGTPLVVDTSVWKAIGTAFYSGTWNFVIVNLLGEVLMNHSIPVNSRDRKAIVDSLIEGLNFMRSHCPRKMIPAFGIGAPGLVDHKTGHIFRADDLGWKDVLPIKDIIEVKTGLPAFVINRYQANGVAEIRYGNHKNSHNMVYLGIGTGISGLIYLDREPLMTTKYRLGHMVIDPHGPMCGCGQVGCLQAMASELALVEFALRQMKLKPGFLRKIRKEDLNGQVIASLAEEGDIDARTCLNYIADPLAIAVSTLANAIAPDEVIIGGPLGDSSNYLVDCIRKRVHAHLLDWQNEQISISQGTQSYFGPAIGAATFMLEQKLELILNSANAQ